MSVSYLDTNMADNLYSYDDPSRDPLTVFGTDCVKFPTNLSKLGIPYVLFGPYERNRVVSIGESFATPTSLLDGLPGPRRTIALPIPSSALSTTFSVGYRDVSLGGAVGSLVVGGKNILEEANKLKNAVQNADGWIDKVKATVGGLAGIAGEAGSTLVDAGTTGALQGLGGISETFKDVATLAMNKTVNPFTEVLYENVPFREHTFVYTFQPKSLHESQTIDKILQYFKFYMLPEFTSTLAGQFGTWLKFPLEWQIIYSIADTTFTLLPSVLTSMQVNYADGVDSPKLFKTVGNDVKRYPTKIDVSMTFKEVSFLTRNQIVIENPVTVEGTLENAGVFDTITKNRTRYRF